MQEIEAIQHFVNFVKNSILGMWQIPRCGGQAGRDGQGEVIELFQVDCLMVARLAHHTRRQLPAEELLYEARRD